MSVELIVLDVDGSMTDGRITYSADGDEIKSFNVKDGLGIASWVKLGRKAAIITGRRSKIVERRAKELKIEYFYQGVREKGRQLHELLEMLELPHGSVAAIGDDCNDISMLEEAGMVFAPADACKTVKSMADLVLSRKGGDGAVREMIDYLIDQEGLREEFDRLWSAK